VVIENVDGIGNNVTASPGYVVSSDHIKTSLTEYWPWIFTLADIFFKLCLVCLYKAAVTI